MIAAAREARRKLMIAYRLQPKTESLAQPAGAAQGANHTGKLGYYGPHPPSGEPPHHYHFQVFALDTVLRLTPERRPR